METGTTEARLLESVAKLAPSLRADREFEEAERDLRPETVATLRECGLFRIWTPRALGGLELAPTPAVRLFEEMARIDSAVGWVVANSAVITSFFQVFPDAGLEEIFTSPDTIVAGGWFPPGAATPTDGGYQVTGQWAFGSGCRHADWLTGMTVILDRNGQPQPGSDGTPQLLLLAVPAADAEVVEHWDTLGMRGTGSHDVRLTDVFVPSRRTFMLGPFVAPGSAFAGPLYKFHMWLGGPEIAAIGLGVARSALETFTDLAQAKTPSYTMRVLADRSIVQDHVARATASIASAEAYLHRALDDAFAHFTSGGTPDPVTLAPVQLASCHAIDSAVNAVNMLQRVAGTSGIRAENGLERHFRDVHTIAQHTLASPARYESVGQLLLGKQSDWTFFYL